MLLRTSLIECTQVLLRTNAPAHKLTCRHIHMVYPKGNVFSSVKPIFTKRSKILVTASFRNASGVASTIPSPAEPDPLDTIPDTPTPILEEPIVEKVLEYHANGEATFASLGLGGYYPPGLVQNGLEWLHISCDLPWCIAISIVTVCVRLILFPFVIHSQRNTAALSKAASKVHELYSKINEAKLNHDFHTAALYGIELQKALRSKDYRPLKTMMPLTVQLPMFISVYMALKQLTAFPIESMKNGGILWFKDLTAMDPYYALPILMCSTLFLTLKIGTDGISTGNTAGFLRYGVIFMPLITLVFVHNFPAAMVYYWLSSNVVALLQTMILRIPKVATYLRIPLPSKQNNIASTLKMDAFKSKMKGWKKMTQDIKMSRKLKSLEGADARQFKEAGQGPIPRTFTYNPTKQMSAVKK